MTVSASDSVREFAGSELFERTFAEGMELVEEAAAYLDGEGRRDSKLLSRNAALAYAGESMRLTTRLMQVASWLLVQRAVREGNMTPEAAREPRYRIGEPQTASSTAAAGEPLPEPLLSLADRSHRLFQRVANLDRRMYGAEAQAETPDANAVLAQFERLRAAFG
jgi:regulator of CtrA degradation